MEECHQGEYTQDGGSGGTCKACNLEPRFLNDLKMMAQVLSAPSVPESIKLPDILCTAQIAFKEQTTGAQSDSLVANLATMVTLLSRAYAINHVIQPELNNITQENGEPHPIRYIYDSMLELIEECVVINMAAIAEQTGEHHAAKVFLYEAVRLTARK